MTQEKEIHFTGYEKQISNWTDLIPAERFTLLVLQTLTEVSKDPRGTYITNDRLSNIIGLSPTRISSTITKLKKKGYITVQRVGATGRYIKTRDYNHATYTRTIEEQVTGVIRYINKLLYDNPSNIDDLEEIDDTYRDAFMNAIKAYEGSDNLINLIKNSPDTFNDIDGVNEWLENKGFL